LKKKEIMTPHPAMVEKTPVPNRTPNGQTYGRSSSLIGFDPLATPSTTASTAASPILSYPPSPLDAPHSAPTTRAQVPLAAIKNGTFHTLLVRPPTPSRKLVPTATKEKDKTLTPKPQSSTDMSNKHRRDVQSFCTADLRSISSEAMEQENLGSALEDSLMIPSSSHMDFGDKKVMPSPSKPKSTQQPKENTKSGIPATEGHKKGGGARPGRISSMLPPLSVDTATTPKKDGQKSEEKDVRLAPNTTPRKRVLPWAKKTHRRIQSLENKEMAKPVTPSATNTPSSERKSSMYPSMIQDLMELSFSQLQMPSLAKPSPTSFLTGKEDEVVRTCELDPSPHQMEIPKLRMISWKTIDVLTRTLISNNGLE
jgi:hypothetical protein